MKKKIFLLLVILGIVSFTSIGYCAVPVANTYGTQTFFDNTIDSSKKYIEYDEVDNVVMYQGSTSFNNTTTYFICPLYNGINYNLSVGSSTSIQYEKPNHTYNQLKCFTTRVDNFTSDTGTNIFAGISTISINSSRYSQVMTSVDLKDSNGNTIISKNMNFTKPVPSSCPTCETCEECEECSGEGECGPVEITNFPIDKTEFYVLLTMLGTLIFMIFFKWCFPMKGGKK